MCNNDVNVCFDNFSRLLSRMYCECFPLKSKFVSDKQISNPWVNREVRNLIRRKENYFHLYKRGFISKDVNNSFKNRANKEIAKAKNSFYLNSFKNAKNDMKKSWEMIHRLAGYKKGDNKLLNTLNEKTSDHVYDIVENFNKFFLSIGETLNSTSSNVNSSDYLNLINRNPNSLFLLPATPDEVSKIICDLKIVKSDIDTMPVKTFIALRDHLSQPISDLINLSFLNGIYPDELKIARIVPIYKNQGNILDPTNYRPISCLPYIGKIFEKCLTNRLISFCDKFSLISKKQFGFQCKKSTCDALINLTETIYSSLNSKDFNITVFIDLKKAFDTVSHSILLNKLEKYGIRGTPLNLIQSYLSNRHSFVEIGSFKSKKGPIVTGVPQGSIISPILFILFINDLPNFSSNFQTTLFADDTTLSITNPNYEQLVQHSNLDLEKFAKWTQVNKLVINVSKTDMMLFTNRDQPDINSDILLQNQKLNLNQSCKFLGTRLDNRLTFCDHINHIVSKISKNSGILYRIRDKLPLKTRLDYYYSFIYPYLSYNVEVWGSTYQTHLDPLVIQHKRVIRTISGAGFRDHTTPLFLKLGLLKFHDICRYHILLKMFHSRREGNFSVQHSVNTRNRDLSAPSFHRLTQTQHAFSYTGPTQWNTLPTNLRNLVKFQHFKKAVKSYLLDQYRPVA